MIVNVPRHVSNYAMRTDVLSQFNEKRNGTRRLIDANTEVDSINQPLYNLRILINFSIHDSSHDQTHK